MIAIDPGAAGGIAMALPGNGTTTSAMPSTDREILKTIEFAKAGGSDVVYLEELVKYAGRNMPSSSMATYAANWGFLKGVLTTLGFRIILVRPQAWQKALSLGNSTGKSKTEWKNHLKQRAEQLYPHITVTLKTSDALLILEAAKRGALG